jgi:hypothetical protein
MLTKPGPQEVNVAQFTVLKILDDVPEVPVSFLA